MATKRQFPCKMGDLCGAVKKWSSRTTGADDTTDETETYLYTIPSYADAFDCLGCEEIVIGVQTALAGTGTTSTAILQAKFI